MSTKLREDGLAYSYGPMHLQGTALGSIPVWIENNHAWLIEPGVPLFDTLIGLAVMAAVLTRLAHAGEVIFMTRSRSGTPGSDMTW